MGLENFIRSEQKLNIYILNSKDEWEEYNESEHGAPISITSNYLISYQNGEVLENTTQSMTFPKGVHYISVKPYLKIKMPNCDDLDQTLIIKHEVSKSHGNHRYCTKITNTSSAPIRIVRFAGFKKTGIFGSFYISTISNDWFTSEHFQNWYNVNSGIIEPGCVAKDQDNFGFGNGYWVYEIQDTKGNNKYIKSRLPKQPFQ